MSYSIFRTFLLAGVLATCSGCAATSNLMNPFYEPPKPVALLGDKNDHALNGNVRKEDEARKAMEAMASYRRTHTPQPQYPVFLPAVVRQMWIPDHLNRNGDLVPAHYYYLKVLNDRPAVTDAFELEGQLNGSGGERSNVPFVLNGDKVE